jgi:hypothetical protein
MISPHIPRWQKEFVLARTDVSRSHQVLAKHLRAAHTTIRLSLCKGILVSHTPLTPNISTLLPGIENRHLIISLGTMPALHSFVAFSN